MCGSVSTLKSRSEECSEDIREGVVIAVGRVAATIAEKVTKRQFYAPLDEWGIIRVGDVVRFEMDILFISGSHRVGSKTYERHYCSPVGS
jgi:hypothetical protein